MDEGRLGLHLLDDWLGDWLDDADYIEILQHVRAASRCHLRLANRIADKYNWVPRVYKRCPGGSGWTV